MFLEFVINFSILCCFTILIYWLFIRYEEQPFIKKFKPVLVGICFAVAGLILTVITTPFANGVLIHNRNIFILFSGLLGGPWAIFISGLIIVSGRYILAYTSTLAFIMMLNILFVTIGLTLFSRKYPITYTNVTRYFFAVTFEHIIVLLIYYRCSVQSMAYLLIYLVCSTVIFYLLLKLLIQLEDRDRQIKQIYHLKQLDLLTQLPNHIALEQMLAGLLQAKIPFELMHVDIRNFSPINHQYGYKTGDEIFTKIAQTILQNLPDKAYLGRIDSDEFYIALIYTTPAETIQFANEVNEALQKLVFEQDSTLQMSAAIGICSSQHYEQLSPLFEAAFRALSYAKRQQAIWICHDNQLKEQHKTHG